MPTVNINYKPAPKQNELHGASEFETLVVGGRGSGKTLAAIMEIYTLSIEYPGNRGLMTRKRATDLYTSTLTTWKKFIPAECYHINEQKHEITVYTGSTPSVIVYAGLDDQAAIKKYRGSEFGFLLFDQAEEMIESDIKELIPCLRHKLPDGRQPHMRVIYLANPQMSYIITKFTEQITDKMKLIQVSTFDNIYRTDGYIDMLTELYKDRPEEYKAMVLGSLDISQLPNVIMKHDKIKFCCSIGQQHIKAHVNRKGVSCDSARFGDDATIIYEWDGTKQTAMKVLYNQSVPSVAAECLESVKRIGGFWVAIDTTSGLGAGSYDIMKQLVSDTSYIKIYGVNSSEVRQSGKYLNTRAEMYFTLADYINQNMVTLMNDPILIGDLVAQRYEYHLDKLKVIDKALIKKELGRSPDRGDATAIGIYALQFLVQDLEQDGRPYKIDDRPLIYRRDDGPGISNDNNPGMDDGVMDSVEHN